MGMYSFVFNQHSEDKRHHVAEVVALYDFITEQNATFSLADLQSLLANDTIAFYSLFLRERGWYYRAWYS